VCLSLPVGQLEKEDAKTRRAGGGTNDRWEKRNVLIVCVLLPIGIDLTLRSNRQRRVYILRVRQAPVLLHVAA
jgi:hypothetical protein